MKEQAIKAITFAFDLIISFYAMVNETIGYFTLQIFSLQPRPRTIQTIAYKRCSTNVCWTELNSYNTHFLLYI